jgi:hypothetical protein
MDIRIELSRGFVAYIDDQWGEEKISLIQSGIWYVWPSGNILRARGRLPGSLKMVYMHRVLMDVPDGFEVDHVDGDGLNNRRVNLRLCVRGQNIANQKARTNKKLSKFKGVCWTEKNGKWQVHAGPASGKRYVGLFNTEEEAARAYDVVAREQFGEFAKCNFPI